MDIQPVVLEGQHVRLEPLKIDHAEAFCEAGRESNLTPESPGPTKLTADELVKAVTSWIAMAA
ncbi:MAG TPA: hypothetical protein VFT48_18000 [Pyrinomonadaceae bacterium]|nr:hypothetical protein [Pyrinomonadaceae bacterium]